MRAGVILLDPWDGADRLTAAALARLPIGEWAADNAVLAVWSPGHRLLQTLHLMAWWGFTYKTRATWLRTAPSSESLTSGVGSWFMSCTEDVLFGTVGRVGGFAKRRGNRGMLCGPRHDPEFWGSVGCIAAPARAGKPAGVMDYLETFNGPHLRVAAECTERPMWKHLDLATELRAVLDVV